MRSMRESDYVYKDIPVEVSAGERIEIVVYNADGSIKQTMCDDEVPAGKILKGRVCVSGYFPSNT